MQTTPDDAVDALTQLPPALIDEIQLNPEAIRPLARGMAAVNLYNTFVKVSEPSCSIKDKLEFQNMVVKLGAMEAKATDQPRGAGFNIVINIPGSDKGVVIDSTSMALENE